MRFNHRKLLVGIIVALFGILAACGGNSGSSTSPTSPVQLTLSPDTLAYSAIVGDAPYVVNITATKGNPVVADTFTVVSSNTAVATVTLSGSAALIAPVGAGTAYINIKSGSGVRQTIVATIAADQTQITLSPAALTYAAIAGSAPYSVTVAATKKDGVTAGTFTVASSNTAVATTTVTGNVVKITPVAAGTANIVFTAGSNTSVTKTIAATIAPDQTAITLNPSSTTYTAFVGDPAYTVIVNAVKNDGVTPDTFSVASSKPAVVTAVANGNPVTITPVSSGTANIVFTSGSNAKVTRTIAATINAAVPQLTLSPSATSYSAHIGDSRVVTVTAIKGDGITADTFTAVSDAPGVVAASPTGTLASNSAVTLVAKSAGVANITFTATSSGLTTSVQATISSDMTALTLSPSALNFSAVVGGTPYTVTVNAVKADGTTPDTFTAASSDNTIATTSPSGTLASGTVVTITPVAPGSANIVFTSSSEPSVTTTLQGTITAPTVSGCDGTEWFCDDFQGETLGATTASKWDLTPATNYGTFAVAADANVLENKVLAYAGNSSVNGSVIGLIPDSVWQNAMNSHTGDYYVEARINVSSAKKNKQVYLLSRYQLDLSSKAEFYNSGLNFNGRSELGYAGNVKLASGAPTTTTVNTWYTVRLEMIGKTASLYVNGVQQTLTVGGVAIGTSYTYPDANALTGGKVGIYSDNDSFQLDDVRVGAVQLALAPNALSYAATVGAAPYTVTVAALLPDGTTPDTFTVSSSNTSVVTTAISGNVVTITPVGIGTANVVFTSGSNSKITRTIAATISAAPVSNPQLTLSPAAASYTAVAGSAPYVVTVTALKADLTPDTFTVASSNTSAATTSTSGNVVSITPVAAGTSNIVFTSGSGLTSTIAATITANLSKITLSPAATSYTAVAGSAPYVVTVTAVKSDGTTADTFTVASSNTAAATTSTTGNVVTITPVAAGTSNIVFTSGSGVTSTIVATITANLSKITLSPAATSYTAIAGSAPYVVTVTAVKSDGTTADTFTVASSNTSAATTSTSGNVVTITPVAAGTSNIVFTSGSGVTTTIAATITANLTQLTLSPAALTYTAIAGDPAYTVTVTATKNDGTPDTFTVTSSNTSAVTATANGNVVTITPVAAGSANILFTSGSGLTRTIAATISSNQTQLTLVPPALTYTAIAGSAPYTVTVTALKSDGVTPDTFTVASSDITVATAVAVGNVVTVTPIAAGTANIVFTSGLGITRTLVATISADLKGITLTPPALSFSVVAGGAPYTVTVAAVKSDGTTADTFTAISSDTTVATTSISGNVVTITPVAAGTANIVITSSLGVARTLVATVSADLTGITLTPPALSFTAVVGGAPYTVTVAAVKSDGTTADTFTATSSNTAVATTSISSNVVTITPVAAGTANIVITSDSEASVTKTIVATITPSFSGCDGTEWFCDDFQTGSTANWTLTPNTLGTTAGAFTVVDDPLQAGNKVLKYTAGNSAVASATDPRAGVIALIGDSVWNALPSKSNYYLEARMMPLYNGTTANKQMFLIGRYQDGYNWYLGGINAQGSTSSTQIEEGWAKAGTISRGSQTKRPIYVPTSTDPDTAGQWHTVRLEMNGSTLTVYLDSEMMSGAKILTDSTFTSGKFGLFTNNKTFLIDDIRVGDATVKPSQLILTSTLTGSTWAAESGDAALPVTVTALKPDLSVDTFTVASSNTAVVTTSVSGTLASGTVVNLNPVGVGTANIVFTSTSNPKLTRTIAATITTSFVMPTATYDLSGGKAYPAVGESAAYIDDKLVLTFDAPPTLGTAGTIRLFKSSDDSLVDIIKVVDKGDTDSIGAGSATQARGVVDIPVWVSGNSLVIAPHQYKMSYDTGYYVAIASNAVSGTLAGQNFTGLGKLANWSFKTQLAPSTSMTTLTVATTGTADFRSVQGALNYVMKNVPTTTPATINVMDGTYQELLFLRGNNNVTIKGQSRTGTIIQYNNYDSLNTGSGASAAGTPTSGGGRALFLVENSDLLTLDTLTLKNTHLRSQTGSGQAETIYFNNDTGRLIAKNAEFYSEQDTLQLKGYNWFYNTLISGNVDFIWGNNRVSLFENSEIRMIGDSSAASAGGYYAQARTVAATDKGFVFLNDNLTYGPGPGGQTVGTGVTAASYLGRSGGSSTYFDNVVYIKCKMDTHIVQAGWYINPLPNPTAPTSLSGWREFGSMDINGTLLDISQRTVNSGQLTQPDIDANFADRAMIFSAYGGGVGWNPQP